MEFNFTKGEGMIPFVLSQILDSCVNGITLSDPDQEDNPIVYANEAFELITGYNRDEIIGRNCRFLQADDKNQESIGQIREGIKEKSRLRLRCVTIERMARFFIIDSL